MMKRPLPLINKKPFKVYRNLQYGCLSVMQKGKVVGHAGTVWLTDVRFHVNQGGRDRCLQKKQKNVHAFVIGKLECAIADCLEIRDLICFTYNPYDRGFFYNTQTHEPIYQTNNVIITPQGVFSEGK